ncbi:hypothetical protein MMC06_004650 [Schaereria dolodes]|nr:hypothetical protein [Schaereria dolodes]
MVLTAASRAKAYDAERYWPAKFVGRIIALLMGFVAIGTISWSISYGDVLHFWAIPWNLISLGLSEIWNITNIAVLFVRSKPIRPGSKIGCDLVLCIILMITGVLVNFAAIGNLHWIAEFDPSLDEPHYGRFPNGTYGIILPDDTLANILPCYPYVTCQLATDVTKDIHHLGAVELVGCVATYLVTLVHFILFVWACVDTHRRRTHKINNRPTEIGGTMITEMNGHNNAFPAQQQHRHQQIYEEDSLLYSPDGTLTSDSLAQKDPFLFSTHYDGGEICANGGVGQPAMGLNTMQDSRYF